MSDALNAFYKYRRWRVTEENNITFAEGKKLFDQMLNPIDPPDGFVKINDPGVKIIDGSFVAPPVNGNRFKNIKKITVGGAEGYYADMMDQPIIYWAKDGIGFLVTGFGSTEAELLQIAESVK